MEVRGHHDVACPGAHGAHLRARDLQQVPAQRRERRRRSANGLCRGVVGERRRQRVLGVAQLDEALQAHCSQANGHTAHEHTLVNE